MSSSPVCKKCGDYIHHGPVICDDCADKLADKVDACLVSIHGNLWTYSADVVAIIRGTGRTPQKFDMGKIAANINAGIAGGIMKAKQRDNAKDD